jgi:hypothetical protein
MLNQNMLIQLKADGFVGFNIYGIQANEFAYQLEKKGIKTKVEKEHGSYTVKLLDACGEPVYAKNNFGEWLCKKCYDKWQSMRRLVELENYQMS